MHKCSFIGKGKRIRISPKKVIPSINFSWTLILFGKILIWLCCLKAGGAVKNEIAPWLTPASILIQSNWYLNERQSHMQKSQTLKYTNCVFFFLVQISIFLYRICYNMCKLSLNLTIGTVSSYKKLDYEFSYKINFLH